MEESQCGDPVLRAVTYQKLLSEWEHYGPYLGNVCNIVNMSDNAYEEEVEAARRAVEPVIPGKSCPLALPEPVQNAYSASRTRRPMCWVDSAHHLCAHVLQALRRNGEEATGATIPADELWTWLESHLRPSAFGDARQGATVVDESVRRSRELDASEHLKLTAEWLAAACRALLLPMKGFVASAKESTALRLRLNKLVVYEAGDKFEPHCDTPYPHVIGTAVVPIPEWCSPDLEGGDLVLQRPGALPVRFQDPNTAVAFFSNDPHCVTPVTRGRRVVLTFFIEHLHDREEVPNRISVTMPGDFYGRVLHNYMKVGGRGQIWISSDPEKFELMSKDASSVAFSAVQVRVPQQVVYSWQEPMHEAESFLAVFPPLENNVAQVAPLELAESAQEVYADPESPAIHPVLVQSHLQVSEMDVCVSSLREFLQQLRSAGHSGVGFILRTKYSMSAINHSELYDALDAQFVQMMLPKEFDVQLHPVTLKVHETTDEFDQLQSKRHVVTLLRECDLDVAMRGEPNLPFMEDKGPIPFYYLDTTDWYTRSALRLREHFVEAVEYTGNECQPGILNNLYFVTAAIVKFPSG